MTTLEKLKTQRPWIEIIDDERDIGNSIIVTLAKGWEFVNERGCGVQGFDTEFAVKLGTSKSAVSLA